MQTVAAPTEEQECVGVAAAGGCLRCTSLFFYRLGMAAVAFAMVLLPLVYLGLIACVGYATYRYAIDGTGLSKAAAETGKGK